MIDQEILDEIVKLIKGIIDLDREPKRVAWYLVALRNDPEVEGNVACLVASLGSLELELLPGVTEGQKNEVVSQVTKWLECL